MVTRRYRVEDLIGEEIRLGRVGEHNARIVEFDVTSWLEDHEGGFVVVFVTPPSSPGMPTQGYLAPVSSGDGIVSWTIRSVDTRTAGNGTVELILYGANNKVVQSATASTKVYASSLHPVVPPMSQGGHHCDCHSNDPNQSWVDQVAKIAYEAQEAAYRAEEALDSMEQLVYESSVPNGGDEGQVLTKLSDKDQHVGWKDVQRSEIDFSQIDIIYGGDASEPA